MGETTIFVYDAGGALAAEYSTVVETNSPTTSYLATEAPPESGGGTSVMGNRD